MYHNAKMEKMALSSDNALLFVVFISA